MSIHDEIKRHMALAFFGSAYADQAEECGQPLAGEIMDQLPEVIDPAALHAADTLAASMLHANGLKSAPFDLESLFLRAVEIAANSDDKGDREHSPEMFGHYCAMQAMGHGVGLSDAFGRQVYDAISVPYTEFGAYSLERDYFEPGADCPDCRGAGRGGPNTTDGGPNDDCCTCSGTGKAGE
ncbi:hypothetical protein ACM7G9_09115 [Pseudomonas aeruginosa]